MSIKTHAAIAAANETDNGSFKQVNACGPSTSMFCPVDDSSCVWIDCGAVSGGTFVPGETVTWNAGGDSAQLMGVEGSGSTGVVLHNLTGAIANADVVTNGTASVTCSGTPYGAMHDIAIPRGIVPVGTMTYGNLFSSIITDSDAYEIYGTKIGLLSTDNFFIYAVAGKTSPGASSILQIEQGSNNLIMSNRNVSHTTSGETLSTVNIDSPNTAGDGTQVAYGALIDRDNGLMTYWGNDEKSAVLDISGASSWSGADMMLNLVLSTQYRIVGMETYPAGATIPTDHQTFLQELLINAASNVKGVRIPPTRHITV